MHGTRTVSSRFAAKVDRSAGPTGCWPFTGSLTDAGYGSFWNGTRLVKAHRFAFAESAGREADGDVDHTCHNGSGCAGGSTCPHRACCNPAHLEDVTHAENVRRGQAGKYPKRWKSVCPAGHPYAGENQYIDPKGHQRCRTCAHQRYLNRKKAA